MQRRMCECAAGLLSIQVLQVLSLPITGGHCICICRMTLLCFNHQASRCRGSQQNRPKGSPQMAYVTAFHKVSEHIQTPNKQTRTPRPEGPWIPIVGSKAYQSSSNAYLKLKPKSSARASWHHVCRLQRQCLPGLTCKHCAVARYLSR